jgi:nicotinamide-nucleotide amidase
MSDRGAATADRAAPGDSAAGRIIAALTTSRTTIAVAESLTGGLLTAEFVSVPGASVVLVGGLVAYDTALKHTLLGVDAEVLAAHGPVHPDVAMQMAVGVRSALAVQGRPVHIGIATTGVAGPDPQGGQPPGTVFIGLAIGADVRSFRLSITGDRSAVRTESVRHALAILEESL